MQSISGINSGAAQPSVPIAGVDETKKVRRPEDETQSHRQKPVMDEYVPEEKPEPSGTRVQKGLKKAALTKMGKAAPATPIRLTVRLKN